MFIHVYLYVITDHMFATFTNIVVNEFLITFSFFVKRGRIEDVVVNSTYQGKQLGKLWVPFDTVNQLLFAYENISWNQDKNNKIFFAVS